VSVLSIVVSEAFSILVIAAQKRWKAFRNLFVMTWTPFTPRSSSVMIGICAAGP
jgi:hypothetical protein